MMTVTRNKSRESMKISRVKENKKKTLNSMGHNEGSSKMKVTKLSTYINKFER